VFDRVVVVDWSANSTPKLGRDSIWIAEYHRTGVVAVENLPTRAAAEAALVDLVESNPTSATLLAVDFSLGYPVGTAAALGLTGEPWSAMWDLLAQDIDDDHRNANNRFAVAAALNARLSGTAAPFWGCPPSRATETLTPTKPRDFAELAEWRAVETCLRDRGHRPFSSWQLLGVGAVGSQSLLGIPMIARLRRRLGDRVEVWPFTPAGGAVVVAEVWPSLLAVDTSALVRDAAQVTATANWLAENDRRGALQTFFSPSLPADVSAAVTSEEGWVLGVAV
jgi:precorrin-8X/cobalt-precorrin-8 methylmutase